MAVCVPGTVETCYSGPPGTLGVGLCAAGTRTCLEDGSGFSACTGETLPRVELAATPEDEDCSGGNECGDKVVWSFRFGSDLPPPPWPGPGPAPFPDSDKILAATVTSAGDTLLIARIHGLYEYAPGKTVGAGALFMRLDPQGTVKTAFDIAAPSGRSLFAAPDGGFFLFGQDDPLGQGPPTRSLARYDAADQLVYQKTFVADSLSMSSVAFLPNGHFLATGSFGGKVALDGLTLQGSIETSSLYLAELDAAGTWLWAKTFNQVESASGRALLLDPSGDVYASGDFGAGQPPGGIDLGGGFLQSPANVDSFYARFTATGEHVWSKQVSPLGVPGASLAALTPEGSILLAGSTAWPPMSLGDAVYYDVAGGSLGDTRFFARVGADGSTISTRSTEAVHFGGLWPQAGGRFHFVSGFRSQDPVDVLGMQAASHAGSHDFMIGTIGADDKLERACMYGSASSESARAAGTSPDGAYVVVGSFQGALDLGNGAPIESPWGLFVAKIKP
jgi:hypothetical protein